jgi:hypothetical protein
VEYARYADDLGVLVSDHWRNAWLLRAVDRRLREELAKLDLQLNDEKSRIVDLTKGEAFGFSGFTIRPVLSQRGKCILRRSGSRPASSSLVESAVWVWPSLCPLRDPRHDIAL